MPPYTTLDDYEKDKLNESSSIAEELPLDKKLENLTKDYINLEKLNASLLEQQTKDYLTIVDLKNENESLKKTINKMYFFVTDTLLNLSSDMQQKQWMDFILNNNIEIYLEPIFNEYFDEVNEMKNRIKGMVFSGKDSITDFLDGQEKHMLEVYNNIKGN